MQQQKVYLPLQASTTCLVVALVALTMSTMPASGQTCLTNDGSISPLDTIRPQVYYFKAGPRSGILPGHMCFFRHIFEYGFQDNEFKFCDIDPTLPTKVITHGYDRAFNCSDNGWIQSLIDTLNKSPRTTYNVFVLNWPNEYAPDRDGFNQGYVEIAAVTRAVGNYMGEFLERAHHVIGLKLATCQLIGHSLGGQIVGFAGQYLRKHVTDCQLGRIISLDPAGPCFDTLGSYDRISPDDALYVEAIHTNIGGYGLSIHVGHRDIIVNNGAVQTGCQSDSVLCSHERVHDLLTYQAEGCQMVAYQCPSYQSFMVGACDLGEPGAIAYASRFTLVNEPINFLEDEYDPSLVDLVAVDPEPAILTASSSNLFYYVSTGNLSLGVPFCLQHYQVRLVATGEDIEIASLFGGGNFEVTLIGADGSSHVITLSRQSDVLWTGLLTFGGVDEPIIIDEAKVRRAQGATRTTVIIDDGAGLEVQVDFMSSVDPDVRLHYSSTLYPVERASNGPVVVFEVHDEIPEVVYDEDLDDEDDEDDEPEMVQVPVPVPVPVPSY